jgi:hypothetical protein
MTCSTKIKSARLATGIAVSAVIALAVSAGPASARWGDRDDHWHHGWSGGYWEAPPPVYGYYGTYGYYPPPVVYGPGVGISLPGVNIGIR